MITTNKKSNEGFGIELFGNRRAVNFKITK